MFMMSLNLLCTERCLKIFIYIVSIPPVHQLLIKVPIYLLATAMLQCDRENHEHLKYLRNAYCVMTNHSIKIKMRELATKPQTNYQPYLQFSFLMPDWLFSWKTVTFQKYFWCSWFSRFDSKRWLKNKRKNYIRKKKGDLIELIGIRRHSITLVAFSREGI